MDVDVVRRLIEKNKWKLGHCNEGDILWTSKNVPNNASVGHNITDGTGVPEHANITDSRNEILS